MIERFSSRRARLDEFLPLQLAGARRYDRIAGYFTSSVLEVAGEALEGVEGEIRIVCNSQLDELDVRTARAAALAQRREWNGSIPEDLTAPLQGRLRRLHTFLTSGKLKVRVLPDARFGLIHGKAGVIERPDGTMTAFMGSANESRSAWTRNYEIVWTDDSPEGVAWVQDEFEALWLCPDAVDLADAVVEEVGRLSRRVVMTTVPEWRADPEPGAATVELPVYRTEGGLWPHQKAFVKMAFDAHLAGGARFVLADQVGLGKTVQLGLAAKLMAVSGDGPVLILAPRPLIEQWQNEMWDLLRFPTAVWDGRRWTDENGVVHPDYGPEGLRHCPRRAGIVSTGLVKRGSEAARILLQREYECVILDEAHHARRRNLGERFQSAPADPNNLLRFMVSIGARTKSMLLATATPVQLDPIEAYDLLDVLSRNGHDEVLGTVFSPWRREARLGLDRVLGRKIPPEEEMEAWEWLRDPLPAETEGVDFAVLRRSLGLKAERRSSPGDLIGRLRASDRSRIVRMAGRVFQDHHPYIRHIVRRTRQALETSIDPATNEPYLKAVRVELYGEGDLEALPLPAFLHAAYEHAEAFCARLGERMKSGFLRTMLLRRVGSTIEAGRLTALSMLAGSEDVEEQEDDGDDVSPSNRLYPLTEQERRYLRAFADALESNMEEDPKLSEATRRLDSGWLERGAILFSQYYDSARWIAERLNDRYSTERIGLYSGAARSGIYEAGNFVPMSRDELKAQVQSGRLRLIVGTDAASEGLNLQRLGTLMNVDLPWNPTRLEQRKGRIQRIGQLRDTIQVLNMRYSGSVEDRVHSLLSGRLESIRDMFGQIPDTLQDAWVHIALGEVAEAQRIIDAVPPSHPFEIRYDRNLERVDWESCARVLDQRPQLEHLRKGWE